MNENENRCVFDKYTNNEITADNSSVSIIPPPLPFREFESIDIRMESRTVDCIMPVTSEVCIGEKDTYRWAFSFISVGLYVL